MVVRVRTLISLRYPASTAISFIVIIIIMTMTDDDKEVEVNDDDAVNFIWSGLFFLLLLATDRPNRPLLGNCELYRWGGRSV